MRTSYIILTSFLLTLLVSCHHSEHKSSVTKYKDMTSSNKNIVDVKNLIEKDKYILWNENIKNNFHVKKAWKDHKEQSCKECHEGYNLKDIKGKNFKRSHWNIKLNHAPADIMNCTTCHDSSSVWTFNVGKKNVPADLSPKLCSQCHSKQKKDWELGAHGKRANGWQSQRAILNCVNCHNPHSPAFKKKWPKVSPYRPLNNEVRL